jgi:hypothetical protein
MKIKAGKYYRTRGGDVIGPMLRYVGRDDTFTAIGHTWYEDGSFIRGSPCKMDLMSEVYLRLLSLAAERDALKAENANLQDDLASAERERAHQHGRADRNAAEYAREQKKRQQVQAENARLREALHEIECSHIPDQPAAFEHSDLDWARLHVGKLRSVARVALGEKE